MRRGYGSLPVGCIEIGRTGAFQTRNVSTRLIVFLGTSVNHDTRPKCRAGFVGKNRGANSNCIVRAQQHADDADVVARFCTHVDDGLLTLWLDNASEPGHTLNSSPVAKRFHQCRLGPGFGELFQSVKSVCTLGKETRVLMHDDDRRADRLTIGDVPNRQLVQLRLSL